MRLNASTRQLAALAISTALILSGCQSPTVNVPPPMSATPPQVQDPVTPAPPIPPGLPMPGGPETGLNLPDVFMSRNAPDWRITLDTLSFTPGRTVRLIGLPGNVSYTVQPASRTVVLKLNGPQETDRRLDVILSFAEADGSVLAEGHFKLQLWKDAAAPPTPPTPPVTPPAPAVVISTMETWPQAERDVLRLINEARVSGSVAGQPIDRANTCLKVRPAGIAALLPVDAARTAARGQATYLQAEGISQTSPHLQGNTLSSVYYGRDIGERMSRAIRETAGGGSWSSVNENVAGGQRSAEQVVRDWVNSNGHCMNIMDPDMKYLGTAHTTGIFRKVSGDVTVYADTWATVSYR